MRLAVYGGSFDPPHRAHSLAVDHVLRSGAAERVLVVPVFQHAFSKQMAPYEHRVRMCQLAFSGRPEVEVSTIEAELEPPSYTVHTLRALRARHPDAELRFVVGTDALTEKHKWHRFEEVCELAPLLVLGRVGVEYPGGPEPVLPDVSSTEVRRRLEAFDGTEEATRRLCELIAPEVLAYIVAQGLYGVRAPGEPAQG